MQNKVDPCFALVATTALLLVALLVCSPCVQAQPRAAIINTGSVDAEGFD